MRIDLPLSSRSVVTVKEIFRQASQPGAASQLAGRLTFKAECGQTRSSDMATD